MVDYQLLEKVKEAKLEEERLLKLRERLEREILELEREKSNPSLLERCLAEKRSLDHHLDDLEELAGRSAEEIRSTLLSQLQDREDGEKILSEITLFQDLENRLTLLEAEGALLDSHLHALIESRERVRKRSVLSYIFGSNPNATIHHALKEGTLSAKKIKEEIPPLLNHPSARPLLQKQLKECLTLLDALIASSETGWSFGKIDETFKTHQRELAPLLNLLSEEKNALKAQRLAEEAQLDRWLKMQLEN